MPLRGTESTFKNWMATRKKLFVYGAAVYMEWVPTGCIAAPRVLLNNFILTDTFRLWLTKGFMKAFIALKNMYGVLRSGRFFFYVC